MGIYSTASGSVFSLSRISATLTAGAIGAIVAAAVAVCLIAAACIAVGVIHSKDKNKSPSAASEKLKPEQKPLPADGPAANAPLIKEEVKDERVACPEETEATAEEEAEASLRETAGAASGGEDPREIFADENANSATDGKTDSSAGVPAAQAGAPLFPAAAKGFYYDRSFVSRLIQSDEESKNFYCALKAEILAYGAKSRISWNYETFRSGKLLVKMIYRGKTLCLLYALSPAKYEDTKYKVEDISEISRYAETPCLYRVTGERRAKYAADLIADVMSEAGLSKVKEAEKVEAPAYESTEKLLRRNLIKLVEIKAGTGGFAAEGAKEEEIKPLHSVNAREVDIMRDEVAAAHVEFSARYADRTRTGIINADTLSAYFKDGETVTLEEIKKRIDGYNKVTYIKVLARGNLDKALTVEADEFSIEAIKMILLTGGKVIRTKRRE